LHNALEIEVVASPKRFLKCVDVIPIFQCFFLFLWKLDILRHVFERHVVLVLKMKRSFFLVKMFTTGSKLETEFSAPPAQKLVCWVALGPELTPAL
jgi:hypothetical protein